MKRKQMGKAKHYVGVYLILTVFAAALWLSAPLAAVPQAAETKAPVAGTAETKNVDAKTLATYKYNPIGKPDPFKPFIEQELSSKKKAASGPLPISPLQREGTEKFKLVGISSDDHHRIAIVQDVKGKAYPIFLGTYIGLNGGRVVEILPDRIIIEETIKADDKRVEDKQAKSMRLTIKLRKDEGEELP
ncbi:MAG TPA: pilus assembly protein PilP [Syntrophales bacterium]|nr:pilus assembly protein PilP [Syntrophales bacterium]